MPTTAIATLNWLESFAYHCQRGSLGRTNDALNDFRQGTDPELHDPQNPVGTFALENDIQELFRTAPEYRGIETFRRKWNLSEELALDILTYYSTRIYYDSAEMAGNVRDVLARLQTVSRDHYLGDHRNEYATHYLFYSVNLTKMSVPEMARLRGISEGQVYQELGQLGLSIREAFAPHLGEVRRRHSAGESIAQIASALGLGTEALEFYLHHEGMENRGVSWERLLAYQGGMAWETLVLVDLFQRGLTHQEIATELNRLSGGQDLRTQASVTAKLAQLGLTQPHPNLSPSNVFIPGYGLVKESGELNPTLAQRFLFDHYRMSDEWLAGQLGITERGLRDFFTRHHITRTHGRLDAPRSSGTQSQLERYQKQRQAIRRILDWIKRNGRIPTQNDFGLLPHETGVSPPAFYGTPTSAFATREEAIRALKVAGQQENIPIRFLDFRWRTIPERIRHDIRQEAVAEIIQWMKTHGNKLPGRSDYGGGPGKVGFGIDQLTGRNSYVVGQPDHANRYFDSYADTVRAIKDAANEAGIPLRFLDFNWDTLPADIRLELQNETIAETVQWMKDHDGRMPVNTDYGGGPPNIRVAYSALSRYFDSREQMIVRLKAEAIAAGLRFRILDVVWEEGLPASLLPEARQEALTEIVAWMARHNGELPKQDDFRPGPPGSDRIHIGYDKLVAGPRPRATVLYSSFSEALLAIKAAASEQGIKVRLLDKRFMTPLTEDMRNELQKEATAEILAWVKANGRWPLNRDFNTKMGGLRLDSERTFSQGRYAAGRPTYEMRIFDSPTQAYDAVRAAAAAEGTVLP